MSILFTLDLWPNLVSPYARRENFLSIMTSQTVDESRQKASKLKSEKKNEFSSSSLPLIADGKNVDANKEGLKESKVKRHGAPVLIKVRTIFSNVSEEQNTECKPF